MVRIHSLDWGSTLLQRRLDREAAAAATASMEVVVGDENDNDGADATVELNLGPYNVSPLEGLHFDNADDTAAS